jgi:hypothetical protein
MDDEDHEPDFDDDAVMEDSIDDDDDDDMSAPVAKRSSSTAKKSSKKASTKVTKNETNSKTKKGRDALDSDNEEAEDGEALAEYEKTLKALHDSDRESIDDETVDGELLRMVEKEKKDYKPMNNPQVMPEKQFVDPVGVDPTDGIVERIMNEQVRKLGGLLMQVLGRKDPKSISDLGKLTYPINLSTACSGTDAPSIALSLIEECIKKMKPESKFSYDHLMSCEIEPFKQGYLGRNFPGALLFPGQ